MLGSVELSSRKRGTFHENLAILATSRTHVGDGFAVASTDST